MARRSLYQPIPKTILLATLVVYILEFGPRQAVTLRGPVTVPEICGQDVTRCSIPCPKCERPPSSQCIGERMNCHCDRNCVLFGDCCVDYLDQCVGDNGVNHDGNDTDQSEPWTQRFISQQIECTPSLSSRDNHNYLAVSRCPGDWTEESALQGCQNETSAATSQRLLMLPVYGRDDIIFKNVYCAICNRIPLTTLTPWLLSVWNCDPVEGEGHSISQTGRPNFTSCNDFRIQRPSTSTGYLHNCYRNFIDSCPSTTNADAHVIRQCESNYTSLVFNTTDPSNVTVYKNVNCAQCNGLQLFPTFDGVSIHGLSCRYDIPTHLNPSHSFSLLFDFTENSVLSVENGPSGQMAASQFLGNCNRLQIYDPFIDICRNLTCRSGTRLHSGQCVDTKNQSFLEGIPLPPNQTSECIWHLSSAVGRDGNMSLTNSDIHVVLNQVSIVDNFTVIGRLQRVIDQLYHDDNFPPECNASTILLVAQSFMYVNASWLLGCDGFTVPDVQLKEIKFSDGVFHLNLSGIVYEEFDFFHVTQYVFQNVAPSREEYLKLCSPFAGRRCEIVSLDRGDFVITGVGKEAVFHHKAWGTSFNSNDVWQLPDSTVRLCNRPQIWIGITPPYPAWLTTLSDLSFVNSACSTLVLIVALVTYSRFSVLRNQPGKIVMNLFVALILAQVVLLVGKVPTLWLCFARAVVLHFAWLAVFLWTSVLAADLVISMRSTRPPSLREAPNGCKILKLSLFAWGTPAVFVGACFVASMVTRDSSTTVWLDYGGTDCWIVPPIHAMVVFGGPVAVIILINCILLAIMMYTVTANRRRLVSARMAQNAKQDILLCIKLMMVTGVTWSLFLAANLLDVVAVWYISVLVNSVHGALIGLIFLLKDNVRALWRGTRLCVCPCRRRQEDLQVQPRTNGGNVVALSVVPGSGSSSTTTPGGVDGVDVVIEGPVDDNRPVRQDIDIGMHI